MANSYKVGVLCARTEDELPMLLVAFGLAANADPSEIFNGDRYWQAKTATSTGARLTVTISCIAASGNTESQLPTERMIRRFQPDAMFFVGIACGIRKFALADVAVGQQVWGYEYVKTTEQGNLDRSRPVTAPARLTKDVQFFNSDDQWTARFAEVRAVVPPRMPVPALWPESPTLHPGIWIASGEKVMSNGELAELNRDKDLIRVGEMEGLGFARACHDQSPPVPWLVIRGISDYGDKSKDGKKRGGPQKDEFHACAAAAAATFFRVFLDRSYTPMKHAYEPAKGRKKVRTVRAMQSVRKSSVTRVDEPKYDVFLSAPMAAMAEAEYIAYRRDVLRLKAALKEYCNFSRIYYAGETLENPDQFDPEDLAAGIILNAMRSSSHFVMLYPEKLVSSVLVEAGYAMAANVPSVIFARNRDDLPFLLRRAPEAVSTIKCYESKSVDATIEMLRRYPTEIFGSR